MNVIPLFVIIYATLAWSQTTPGGMDFTDALGMLKRLASMDEKSQRIFLAMMGTQLKTPLGMDCNIFGGEPACQMLPQDSSFAKQCPGVNSKVDCAFYMEAAKRKASNPADNMATVLGPYGVQTSCPECIHALQDLYCAVSLPKCGTFNNYTTKILLPILLDIVEGTDSASPDDFVKVFWSGLPCREMCLALKDTCRCGGENEVGTLGSLLEDMYKDSPMASLMPESLAHTMFSKVKDMGLCDIFPLANTPGFSGTCSSKIPKNCSNPKDWCGQGGATSGNVQGAFDSAQQALAAVVMRAIMGWVQDLSDELQKLAAGGSTADSSGDWLHPDASQFAGNDDSGGRGGLSGGQVTGIVFLVILVTSAVAAVAVYQRRRFLRERNEGQYYELQRTEAFEPLQEAELGNKS